MSDLGKRLGRRIYGFRKQNGLTQAALADKADISNEFMSAVERGAKLPSLDVLERIAAALKVEMKDLFNFDRSPFRKLEPLPRDVMDLAVKMQALPSKHRRAIGKALQLFSNLDT
jgi:transcriptional regulator with XRE-family HTH domain